MQCIHALTLNYLTQVSPLPPASCLRPAKRAGSTNRPTLQLLVALCLPQTQRRSLRARRLGIVRTSGVGVVSGKVSWAFKGKDLDSRTFQASGCGIWSPYGCRGIQGFNTEREVGSFSCVGSCPLSSVPPLPGWICFLVFLECTLNTAIYLKPPP